LTVDAALMLVDTALQQAKATGGATRAEVETAIADLVRAGIASHVPGRDGVVMIRPPESWLTPRAAPERAARTPSIGYDAFKPTTDPTHASHCSAREARWLGLVLTARRC
jgi:hypothetical protein